MTKQRIDMAQINYRSDDEENLSIDTAIIGAGVSGLYAGYRLLCGEQVEGKTRPESVHIFDLGDRVGGRLESIQLPEMDVIGELGGMHYAPQHKITAALIEQELQLPYTSFPLGNTKDYIYYLRGRHHKGADWEQSRATGVEMDTGYRLHDQDKDYRFDELVYKMVYDMLAADPWFVSKYNHLVEKHDDYTYVFRFTAAQWDDIKRNWTYLKKDSPYDGLKFRNIGFWNVVKDQLGQEGYSYIADTEGYYSNTMNWNAAEAIAYMIGNETEEEVYRTIATGYDQIAYALADAFTQAPGAQLWLENELITFGPDPSGKRRYQLTFLSRDGVTWTVRADKLIFAMPKRSLERLTMKCEYFSKSEELQKQIDTVFSIPSFKLLMGFEYPWWKELLGVKAGKAITDLPMSQCYYFGSDPVNSHALLLASYNDMRTVQFWNELTKLPSDALTTDTELETAQVKGHEQSGSLRHPAVLKERALPGETVPACVVKEALHQLGELHGVTIPEPYVVRAKDWSADPFGAGYHNWRIGVNVHEVIPFMRHPLPGEDIHIIGDAYSGQQGWIEGAFCVTEKLLQESFGVKWPDWLKESYYLGY